jgi:hypothetical protein
MQYLPNKHHHNQGITFWMFCDCVQILPRDFHLQMGLFPGRQGQHKKMHCGTPP